MRFSNSSYRNLSESRRNDLLAFSRLSSQMLRFSPPFGKSSIKSICLGERGCHIIQDKSIVVKSRLMYLVVDLGKTYHKKEGNHVFRESASS